MRTFPFRGLAATGLVCLAVQGAAVQRTVAQPVRVESFIFGSRLLDCEVPGEPGRRYTVVLHGSPDDLEYRVARGWGYEVVNPGDASRRGYGRFGPFDDSPNNRTQFPDTCPSEIYDSFIGAKTFGASCVNQPAPAGGPCLPPEGIVFRVDVPNGAYRFVAAVGSADNTHVSRIVVEDGGQGPPASLGPNHVVLVNNHDQAAEGPGVFARVGFDGFLPPAGAVNGFVNMDENGMATGAAPSSPTLQVTAGTIRVHQMKGATIGGDGNGGNMVVLELWRVSDRFTPVERGSNWRYLQGLQEASSPANAWRELGFDDGGWSSGPAPFGYSDGPFGTDVSLLEPPMRLNYSSLYLRRTFDVPRIAAVNQLVARVDYDDGFLMWINGTEVLRVNVPGAEGSPVSFDGLASTGHESGLVEEYFLPDPTGYLLQGANVVAVQVFNVNLTSSDLRFEAEIFDPVAPDLTPPGIDLLVPAPGITVRSLRQVEVAFSEDVSGVDASDLLVDGAPATRVTGSGRGPYVFSFPERSPGPVDVAWAVDHGITDLAEFPNDFQASGWTYIVDPEAPVGNLVIAEILAVNRSGMTDEDGDRSDWIEILNQGAEVVNVGGWSLTDELDDPGKFVLPGVALGPQECLLVFASGKDRRLAGSELHANFKMSSTGEYIGLYNGEVPRELVSEIAPRFPRQRADFSYGIDSLGDLVYFETPTPCTPNSGSVEFDGFVLQPVLTPERGIYGSAVFVAMSTATPGSTIRYTLDGSEPTATRGTVYRDPVRVVGTAGRGVITLRAVAVRGGLLPSEVVTHTYVFPEHVMRQPPNPAGFPSSWNGQAADYGMDPQVVNDPGHNQLVRDGLTSIPTLSLVAPVDGLFGSSRGILANPSREGLAWERAVSAELIYPDGRQGFQVNCGLRVQGGSSTRGWKVLKVSMRLLFKGDYGPTKLRFPLFPDTPVESFDTIVLDAHLNQTWNHPSHGQRVRAQYCRDQFVSDLQNAMGGFAPHDVFAHLYVNGLYWGVYDLHERPDHSFAASYFGGDKLDYDAIRHNSSTVLNGSASAWNVMLGAARRDLSVPANYENLGLHVDVDDLIDYMLVNFYTGNDDWPHHNWYATRLRAPGAGYRIHSWDAEHVLKSRSIDRTGAANSGTPAEVYSRLRANSEFRLLFADHAQRHFSPGGALYVNPASRRWNPESPQNNVPASIYMRRIDEIDPAIACEAARWGDLRRPARPYTRNAEWAAEL
ncbi:MAG: CotH kinase family protein, partial [Planctomycetota bacterium]|nr:CotH kinase family protein [Planctomycetota bacterium]